MDEGEAMKPGSPKKKLLMTIAGVAVVVALGVASGWGLVQVRGGGKMAKGGKVVSFKGDEVTEAGIADEETFRDSAEGVLEVNDGSITKEGTHMLIRPGGESQTAFLTSSVVNLDDFVGKKVKVWGETFAGQSAGWFMDVGRIKVVE
jgi:hypothetical protein